MFRLFSNSKIVSRAYSIMSASKNIGVCQMRSTNDKLRNREQVETLVSRSIGKAEFLFFPECCDYVGSSVEETKKLAEPLSGETVQFYKSLCKKHSMWMSFGGVHEIATDDTGKETGKIFNTHIIIDAQGEIAGIYRKLHLFDVDTPEFKFRESRIVQRGRGLTKPIDTIAGNIGMLVCYDIRFPEAATWLKKQNAQIITYPSAFSVSTGKAHWDILNRSRAIENQCYVVSAAQKGKHNEKRSSWGEAIVVGPFGEVLAKCTEELEVQFVQIDLEKIAKVESNMPCFQHRRDDVYEIDVYRTANSLVLEPPFVFEKYTIDEKTIFARNEHCLAFTNIRCVVPGHVLVATKRTVPRIKDMDQHEIKDFFLLTCRVSNILDAYYDAKSTTINVQDGVYAGQTVKHVHCHIMPRRPNDFLHNDEIYLKLAQHDHDPVEPRRPIEEMIEEAQIYKRLFEENQ